MRAIAIASGLLASIVLGACDGDPPDDAGGIDFSAIDRTVDPCSDFYRFACNGWLVSHPPFEDGAYRARFLDPYYAQQPVLRDLIASARAGERGPDFPQAEQVAAYHRSCMAAPSRASAREELQPGLRDIQAIASLDDLARVAARQRRFGSVSFFHVGVARDSGDATRHLVYADQAGGELPDRSYYLDPALAWVLPAYRAHIQRLSAIVAPGAPVDPDAVLRVETAMATAGKAPAERRDPRAMYNRMSREDFIALAPRFPWLAFFRETGLPEFTEINVMVPAYFQALDRLLGELPLQDLKHYLSWQWIDDKSALLDDLPVAEQFDFHQRVLLGVPQQSPRDWICFEATVGLFGHALARPYVARYFPPSARTEVAELVAAVRAALLRRVQSASWLDDATRVGAMAKLDALAIQVGHPDQWPAHYAGVPLGESLLDNNLRLNEWWFGENSNRLAMPVDRLEWYMAPIEVNAYYSPPANAIAFPAGILQAPFFGLGHGRATNLGALGTVAGHELTHGLDDEGRHYDAVGSLRDWWTPAAETMFTERAQCVVAQANRYEALPGQFLDGQLTLGENLADLGGVTLAHDVLASGGESSPSRQGFDQRQQFFLSYAQTWCENVRPEWQQTLLRTNPHAPGRYRVNGTLSQVPEFAAAFQCPAGAPMNPATRCQLW